MSTLKVIFDFLLSVVKVIFPGKRNGRHCRQNHTVPHPHRPNHPTPEGDGSSSGSGGSNPVNGKAGEAKDSTDVIEIPPDGEIDDRLAGYTLIATAIIGYLCKVYLSTIT